VSISPKRSDEELPTKAVYVGRTQDGSLAVAIAVLGDRAVAYVCDGRTREAWLRGSAGHGQVSVGSRTGWVIRAGLHDNRLRGTLQVSERTSRFDVGQAKPPAGLYRSRTARAGIGWIVLPNGSQVGLATTSDGTTSAAPRLNPAQRAAVLNGAPVSAEPVDGNTDV